jgi:hypothetical protein
MTSKRALSAILSDVLDESDTAALDELCVALARMRAGGASTCVRRLAVSGGVGRPLCELACFLRVAVGCLQWCATPARTSEATAGGRTFVA